MQKTEIFLIYQGDNSLSQVKIIMKEERKLDGKNVDNVLNKHTLQVNSVKLQLKKCFITFIALFINKFITL